MSLSFLGIWPICCETVSGWSDAEPLYREALEIKEVSYGPDSPEVATTASNLVALLAGTGRLDEAEQLLQRALKINEDEYGDDPIVAQELVSMAMILKATGRTAEAEPLVHRAIQIFRNFEREEGAPHPEWQNIILICAHAFPSISTSTDAEQ